MADAPTWQPLRLRRDAWRLEHRGVSALLQESEGCEWLLTCEAAGLREHEFEERDLVSAQRAARLIVAARLARTVEALRGMASEEVACG